jgi:leucyl-tRNA synthetase
MSKSRGNVVNPDDVVSEYGADSLRLFEMFMGPLTQTKPWSTKGVEGVYRFLGRVWRLVLEENQEGAWVIHPALQDVPAPAPLLKVLHKTIRKVGTDIEALSFNTAIAELMVLVNELTKAPVRPRSVVEPLLLLLAPFAPHMAEELWSRLGHESTLAYEPWPVFDPALLVEDEVEIVVQVNGKIREKLLVPANLPREDYEPLVKDHAQFSAWTGGRDVKKIVVVPGKLVNLVVA